jgi:hypothetical protein
LSGSSLRFLQPNVKWIDLPLATGFCPAYHLETNCVEKEGGTTKTCHPADGASAFGSGLLDTRPLGSPKASADVYGVRPFEAWYKKEHFTVETTLVETLGKAASLPAGTVIGVETDYVSLSYFSSPAEGESSVTLQTDTCMRDYYLYSVAMMVVTGIPLVAAALLVYLVYVSGLFR